MLEQLLCDRTDCARNCRTRRYQRRAFRICSEAVRKNGIAVGNPPMFGCYDPEISAIPNEDEPICRKIFRDDIRGVETFAGIGHSSDVRVQRALQRIRHDV